MSSPPDLGKPDPATGDDQVADVVGSAEFAVAVLKSERVRVVAMIALFALLSGVGLLRINVALAGNRAIGVLVLGCGLLALGYEIVVLRAVGAALRRGQPLGRRLQRTIAVVEPSVPLVLLAALIVAAPANRFLFVGGGGSPLLLTIVILSVLSLDRISTAVCGAIASVGYAGLVLMALGWRGDPPPPYPALSYLILVVFFAACCAASLFVSVRMRRYVVSAVREMQTRRERDQLQHELELASEIQKSLLPPHEPPSEQFDIAAMSRPAAQTGGDYYDWQELEDGRLLVSLADVTGHGIGPAMVTAACRAYVRANAEGAPDPVGIVTKVNALLHRDLTGGKFVTFALIELDPATHRGTFLSAGHGPNYFVRAHDGEVEAVGSQSLPLGLLEEQDVEAPVEFDFGPGDAVVLTSDGFFEWSNTDGEQFGTARLTEVIRAHRHESAEQIITAMDEAVTGFVGSRAQDDDMTAVVIRRIE
jgi:serine phosphatase RsbU (regulator of sigma subunit)